MRDVSGRRSFVTTLASVAGLAAFRSPGEAAAQSTPASAGPFDMAWLEQMKGKHKQLYDLGSFDLAADDLTRARLCTMAAERFPGDARLTAYCA